MPIVIFIGRNLTELFKKLTIEDKYIDRRVQLFFMHPTMFVSNTVFERKKILGLNNKEFSL